MAGPASGFGGALGDPGPGPLWLLARTLLRSAGRRICWLRAYPAGPQTWLFLGGALGVCEAVGLDPSLGVVGAIAGGLPQSPPLLGGFRGALALLLFASGLWLLLGFTLRLGLRLLLGGTAAALGRPGPPPRLWMALVRMFSGRHPGLRSFQGVLPPLPLPPLHDTVHRVVASLQALGPGGDPERLPTLAREFLGGPGPKLQRWLRLRAWTLPCYLSDLWEEHVHLGGRDPLPTSNYYLMDLPGPPPTRLPAARAANAVFALLRFRSLVIRGELPPPLFRGTLPLCSAQYEHLFNTSRLPGEKRDRLWHGGGGGHVAVLCGGRLFRVLVTRRGRPLRPRELQSQFQRVLEEGEPPLDPQEALGVLTAGERPPWARTRAALRGGAALRALDEAPFVVAFDPPGAPPEPPGDPPGDGHLDAEARALLHGPWHNRWFDKSFTLIVFASGRLGLNAEQSWGDPPVLGHLWEYTLAAEALELGYESSGDCRGGEEPHIPPPQRLDWDIPPQCREALSGALDTAQALAADLELHVFTFVPPPGSPPISDALVQLALQLALVRERGPCLSYEPVPTRLFHEGRTDGVRGCGPPVLALAAAMGDPETRAERRRALLWGALRHQREQLQAALTGSGLERHLQALEATAAAMGLRDPFLEEVLGHPWALASSPAPRADPPLLPPSLHPAGGGFGPPHRDGYGVSFARGGDGSIIFHISCSATSTCTDTRGFAGKIREALGELGELGWGEE